VNRSQHRWQSITRSSRDDARSRREITESSESIGDSRNHADRTNIRPRKCRNTVSPNRSDPAADPSRRVTAGRNQLGRQSQVNCRSRRLADQCWQDRPVMSVTLAGKEALSILTGRDREKERERERERGGEREREREREREGRASKRHRRVGETVARGLRRGTRGLAFLEIRSLFREGRERNRDAVYRFTVDSRMNLGISEAIRT